MKNTSVDLRNLIWTRGAGSVCSDGAFLKATSDDYSLYYKMSGYNSAQGVYGHEAINELVAYRVAKELGVPAPPTTLTKALVSIDNSEFETHIAVSESFKTARDSRMSFDDFYKSVRREGETALSVALRYGWEQRVSQMFLYDFLIINRDRHGANLEVLETDGEKRLSPLFDNGLSFACSCASDVELEAFDIMADRQVNNFIGTRSLHSNLKSVTTPIKVKELREEARSRLFDGLDGIISKLHQDVIWRILWERYNYAKKICDMQPGDD